MLFSLKNRPFKQLKNYASQEDKYQVPKRTISLLTRWKTLEQIRRNYLNQSFQRQQKKQASPGEEPWSPITSEGLITAVGRGYQRSLRPPGQPLRWG